MKNILSQKHEGQLPQTHDRGRWCLDLLAVSNVMDNRAVKRCGYLPFYEGIATDHQAVYMDIDVKYLFTKASADTNKSIYRHFTTDQPKNTDKYLKCLEEKLEEARIFRKVNVLKKEMQEYLKTGKGDIESMIERCKVLSEKTSQLMIHSEQKIGRKHYRSGYPLSPILKKAAYEVMEIKKQLRIISLNDEDGKEKIITLKNDLKTKYKELRQAQKISKELRKKHLNDLAFKQGQQWNLSASQAVVIIKEAEESKEIHKKHKRMMKPTDGGAINELYVPAPVSNWEPEEIDITNVNCQMKVTDSTEIFNILL